MALAILELLYVDGGEFVFRLERGTNTSYRLEIGSRVERREGETRVQDVYHVVPQPPGPARPAGPSPWEADIECRLPQGLLRRGPAYAQLVTWKEGGRAMAVSEVVELTGTAVLNEMRGEATMKVHSQSLQEMAANSGEPGCRPPRAVPHRLPPLATAASLDGLIGEILKLAAPLVTQLLQQAGSGSAATQTGAPGGAALGGLMQVLQGLLGDPEAKPPLAKSKSLGRIVRSEAGNRFFTGGPRHVAEPFIFGIDDALIASLVGPVLQILPQLMNAANNKRIELKKADNALMGGIVSDVQKRLMLEKLMESQRAAQAQGPAAAIDPAQIEALVGLLGSLPAQSPTVAGAKSLSRPEPPPAADHCRPSDRAVLRFEFGNATTWAGSELPVFQRGRRVVLRPRLVVSGQSPRAPLPKAILRLQLRDALHPEVCVEKCFKLLDLHPDMPLECDFDAAELAPLPEQARLTVLAQLRWPHGRGTGSVCATGSAEIVLVGAAFLCSSGGEVDGEREPADMARYRSFWNKLWQAPAAHSAGDARLWELDVQTRYTTLVENRHDSNGLMETRLLGNATDPGALSARTKGRMKAGIVLSLSEINRLLPLWNGRTPLDGPTLDALGARPMLAEAAREAYCRLRLKGRTGQGGMVWTVPVFKLQAYTLSSVSDVDERGQVRATAEAEIAFPMPVAVRALGLKANT